MGQFAAAAPGRSAGPSRLVPPKRVSFAAAYSLGNLLPLPKVENNEAANHSWQRKKILLGIFAAESKAEAQAGIEAAKEVGITLGKKAEAIALENTTLPLAKSAATYDGTWDADFIALRSKRLAELAWDRMAAWLGPAPPP